MAKVKKTGTTRKIRPAMTPKARENQMIALAMDAAERQLLDGSASSQVITHFLKLGTERERLEREKLEKENIHLLVELVELDQDRLVQQKLSHTVVQISVLLYQ